MPDFDQMAWDMFFANLAGIQYHPANRIADRQPLSELAAIADEMLKERNKRCHFSPLLP